MPDLDPAVAQLTDELDSLAARVGAVLGTDLQLALTARATERGSWLVGQLSDGDEPDATAADLLALLWPDEPDLDWWRTPLGLLVAPTVVRCDSGPGWSRAEAAAVLGVSAGTVAQLEARGDLERVEGGGISRRSVLARLVRMMTNPTRRTP